MRGRFTCCPLAPLYNPPVASDGKRSTTPPASAEAELAGGATLGQYRIVGRIARGGMAEIYLAERRSAFGFDRIAVLKRILPRLADEPAFQEMFLDEARIAATLEHPNVVQVYEVGEEAGNLYMAMEYLDGATVRSLVRELGRRGRRLPLEHALAIVNGVCAGLHYAHGRRDDSGKPLGIIHRDVSPHNVMVTLAGAVKLLDFGIAKASTSMNRTRAGSVKGKIAYMSPEQCLGTPLDRRTDVYSLGIMLYELTLGVRLYEGASDFERMRLIVDGQVTPPRAIDPGYDRALEVIVMRALEKDRERRYGDLSLLQGQLDALIRDQRLYVSTVGLAGFMTELFGQRVAAIEADVARGLTRAQAIASLAVQDEREPEAASGDDVPVMSSASWFAVDNDATTGPRSAAGEEARAPTESASTRPLLAIAPPRRELSVRLEAPVLPFRPPSLRRRFGGVRRLLPRRLAKLRGPRLVGLAAAVVFVGGLLVARLATHRHAPAVRASSIDAASSGESAVAPRARRALEAGAPPEILRAQLPAGAAVAASSTPSLRAAAALVAIAPPDRAAHDHDDAAAIPRAPVGSATKPPHAGPSAGPSPAAERAALRITTSPPGAAVFVDGVRLPEPSPTRVARLAPGKHTLLATLRGRQDLISHVELAAGAETSLSLVLPPAPAEGRLLLTAREPSLVFVDGQPRGNTPLLLQLRAGKHTVLVVLPHHRRDKTLHVHIRPNRDLRLRL